jgi:hypothetical protein
MEVLSEEVANRRLAEVSIMNAMQALQALEE